MSCSCGELFVVVRAYISRQLPNLFESQRINHVRFLALIFSLLLFGLAAYLFVRYSDSERSGNLVYAIIAVLIASFLSLGIIVVSPNHSRVLTFFGKYVGTVKENGLLFVNPLFKKQQISLQSENLESDEEKKAAMVSNLMVVLCGEKGAQPILNTGTLYQ